MMSVTRAASQFSRGIAPHVGEGHDAGQSAIVVADQEGPMLAADQPLVDEVGHRLVRRDVGGSASITSRTVDPAQACSTLSLRDASPRRRSRGTSR